MQSLQSLAALCDRMVFCALALKDYCRHHSACLMNSKSVFGEDFLISSGLSISRWKICLRIEMSAGQSHGTCNVVSYLE